MQHAPSPAKSGRAEGGRGFPGGSGSGEESACQYRKQEAQV